MGPTKYFDDNNKDVKISFTTVAQRDILLLFASRLSCSLVLSVAAINACHLFQNMKECVYSNKIKKTTVVRWCHNMRLSRHST